MGISTNYCDILQGVPGCGEHKLKIYELGKFPPKTFITIIDAIVKSILSEDDPNFKGFKLCGADMKGSEIDVVCNGRLLVCQSIYKGGPNYPMKIAWLLDTMFQMWINGTKYNKEVVDRTRRDVMRVLYTNAGYATMDYVINKALNDC